MKRNITLSLLLSLAIPFAATADTAAVYKAKCTIFCFRIFGSR